MTDAAEQRIAVLESVLRALKMLLGTQQRTLTAPRRDEPSVRITHPVRHAVLPTDDEFERLLEVVLMRYPTLRPAHGEEAEFFSGFRAAFRFVQHHGRRAEPDRQRALGWWIDTARDWVSQNKIGAFPISGTAFVAAVIAAGDVSFSSPEEPGFAIGLQFGGGGIPSKDWWRRVLCVALLDPVPSPYQNNTPSPARVRQV
jgi:hypothetical protein